jgi:hypothetical protein
MKQVPILFQAHLVREILSGRKKVTRRIAKLSLDDPATAHPANCSTGDTLWVRETWQVIRRGEDPSEVYVPERIPKSPEGFHVVYRATAASGEEHGETWRPSIHMPRWASRIDLRVSSVELRRLQSSTKADAHLEGFDTLADFRDTWDKIYERQGCGWSANPLVWCIQWE